MYSNVNRNVIDDHHRRDLREPPVSWSAVFKDIADSADGVHQFFREWLVYFLSQTADGDIHHVRIAIEIHVPHLLGNDGAREDFARAPGEQRQEIEFLGGQIDAFSLARHFATGKVDF